MRSPSYSRFSSSFAGRMAVRWLTVVCALALLVQVSLSIPEEDIQQEELESKLQPLFIDFSRGKCGLRLMFSHKVGFDFTNHIVHYFFAIQAALESCTLAKKTATR